MPEGTAEQAGVRTATGADRRAVLALLVAAFEADPVVGWLLGPDLRNSSARKRRRLFFRALTGRALRRGWCDVAVDATGAVVGATVWYPPDGLPTGLAQLAVLPGLVRALGRRLPVAGAADATMLAHHPTEPHWYLQFAGVRPDRTGRGIGSALLAHRLALVDRQGLAAYLESSSARNDPLYARHGFEPVTSIRLGPGAPSETLMLRPARRRNAPGGSGRSG